MRRFLAIIFITALGYALDTFVFHGSSFEHTNWYHYFINTLLAIGLYGSVYGLERTLIRMDKKVILSAISIGVLLKTAIITLFVWVFTKNAYALILALIVAQIDPLSVVSISNRNRLSERGNSILKAWASFDDPMTVVLSIFAAQIISKTTMEFEWSLVLDNLLIFGFNLAFAIAIYILNKLATKIKYADYILFVVALTFSIYFNLIFAIAIIGLFLRPKFEVIINKSVNIAFLLSSLVLGFLLAEGMDIKMGIWLGLGAVLSQVIVGFMLFAFSDLGRRDKLYLAFAQQSGITAIVLALLFEPQFKTVAIVGPAIFTINIIYVVSNGIIERIRGESSKNERKVKKYLHNMFSEE